MRIKLYKNPMKIEMVDSELFVDGGKIEPDIRMLSDMDYTFLDADLRDMDDYEMYYMYREIVTKNNIRYDITIIPPREINGECAKTHGHDHPLSKDGVGYPEIYQILKGKAVFMLQKENRDGSVNVRLINANAGDVVLIPPGWGHVTINSGDVTLVLSNIVSTKFESDYGTYKRSRGPAYHYMKNGEIIHNTNYVVKETERLSVKEHNSKFGFSMDDLLEEIVNNPEKLEFLNSPSLLSKE